jgi:secretion/DNA translocation related TadE-like protein
MPGRSERGSAGVLALAMLGVLLFTAAGLGVVGAIVHAHRQAQSAADLAALAGATALGRGRDACVEAGATARANDGVLSSCAVVGRDVQVEVTVSGPRWLGQDADLTSAARAGPVR